MRKLRNTLVGVVAMSLVAILIPAQAHAANSPLTPGSFLVQPHDDGSFHLGTTKSIYNSSGQKIGEYELGVRYVQEGSQYIAYADIRVKDTLIGNGRGVKVKLMTKTGTNTSNVIGIYKGGNNTWSQQLTNLAPQDRSQQVWAFDVDHGEDWAGVSFQYTGHFDRYVKQSETTKDNWPFFAVL